MGAGTIISLCVSMIAALILLLFLVMYFFPSVRRKMEESNRKSREEAVRLGKEREALAAEERRQKFAEKRSGNHSFLPLHICGDPIAHSKEIFAKLEQFEKENPELEITRWVIEKQQSAYGEYPYIFGLWIDHRPKK